MARVRRKEHADTQYTVRRHEIVNILLEAMWEYRAKASETCIFVLEILFLGIHST